jgi:hypothetical protein
MSAEMISAANGILTAKISGKLTHPQLAALQKSAAEYIEKQGEISVLILTENFQGWEKGGDWADVSFSAKHDRSIKKIAIVGDKAWEGLALVFTAKGIRRVPIEYFQPADLVKAKAWVAA